MLFNAGRYEESRAASERALEIDPDAASATAFSNIAATSALLGDLPRARTALAETLRVWPNMSVTTLRALFASIPEAPVEEYFRGLRLAGWMPDEEDAPTQPDPSREDSQMTIPPTSASVPYSQERSQLGTEDLIFLPSV